MGRAAGSGAGSGVGSRAAEGALSSRPESLLRLETLCPPAKRKEGMEWGGFQPVLVRGKGVCTDAVVTPGTLRLSLTLHGNAPRALGTEGETLRPMWVSTRLRPSLGELPASKPETHSHTGLCSSPFWGERGTPIGRTWGVPAGLRAAGGQREARPLRSPWEEGGAG